MTKTPSPIVLIILDGFGHSDVSQHNAIKAAHAPCWQHLWQQYPHLLLNASGLAVGLPEGQMGNSEVGHMHMGAGRVVYQDLTRIDCAIADGSFAQNTLLQQTFEKARSQQSTLHIMGLLSPGGVHSHEQHIHALVQLAVQQSVHNLCLHAFLDGRDTPPQSALAFIDGMQAVFDQTGHGHFASMSGRYYAMDRDQRWDRTQKTYELLTTGQSPYQASSAQQALLDAYARGESDEFVTPTGILYQGKLSTIKDNDIVIFMNFRADRARQLTRAMTMENFTGFNRSVWPKINFLSLTRYADEFTYPVIFPPQQLTHTFGEYIAEQGLRQLRIAETEKYAHVTFFFNGGIEQTFPGEDRILIPSPRVATYDQQPAMSAPELTQALIDAILKQHYDVIICNFANPDMLGHTGDFTATVTAIEVLDECLAKIVAALHQVGGEAIITADHGNAECMYDEAHQQPHTAHTTALVPFVYVGQRAKQMTTDKIGQLSDIAPTLLTLLNLPIPNEMTGHSLLTLK